MAYSSQYYDPQKAHDYYERTKQLKGRRSSASLSKEGKEVWSVTKDSINKEKKTTLESEKQSNTNTIDSLRTNAAKLRENIQAKLSQIAERLKQKAESIGNTAEQVSEKAATEKDSLQEEVKKISNELKTSLNKVRESYKIVKEQINTKYNQTLDSEYDKIASTMGAKKKGTKK